jgi:hypothetical protein
MQEAFRDVKDEVRHELLKHDVTQMTMKPVKRQYAFENTAVPHGTHWVLKVGASVTRYSALYHAGDTPPSFSHMCAS